jgi:hypothetical protein
MAVITATVSDLVPGAKLYTYEALTESDTAEPIRPPTARALGGSVQFTGTFGGATVVLQGSNDGTNWVTLKDTQGEDISATDAGMFEFTSAARYLRVSASGGTSQSINAYINTVG